MIGASKLLVLLCVAPSAFGHTFSIFSGAEVGGGGGGGSGGVAHAPAPAPRGHSYSVFSGQEQTGAAPAPAPRGHSYSVFSGQEQNGAAPAPAPSHYIRPKGHVYDLNGKIMTAAPFSEARSQKPRYVAPRGHVYSILTGEAMTTAAPRSEQAAPVFKPKGHSYSIFSGDEVRKGTPAPTPSIKRGHTYSIFSGAQISGSKKAPAPTPLPAGHSYSIFSGAEVSGGSGSGAKGPAPTPLPAGHTYSIFSGAEVSAGSSSTSTSGGGGAVAVKGPAPTPVPAGHTYSIFSGAAISTPGTSAAAKPPAHASSSSGGGGGGGSSKKHKWIYHWVKGKLVKWKRNTGKGATGASASAAAQSSGAAAADATPHKKKYSYVYKWVKGKLVKWKRRSDGKIVKPLPQVHHQAQQPVQHQRIAHHTPSKSPHGEIRRASAVAALRGAGGGGGGGGGSGGGGSSGSGSGSGSGSVGGSSGSATTPPPMPRRSKDEVLFTARLYGVQWMDMPSSQPMQRALVQGVGSAAHVPASGVSITEIHRHADGLGIDVDVAADVPLSHSTPALTSMAKSPAFVFTLARAFQAAQLNVRAKDLTLSSPSVIPGHLVQPSTAGALDGGGGSSTVLWIQGHTTEAVGVAFGLPFALVGLSFLAARLKAEFSAAPAAKPQHEHEMQVPATVISPTRQYQTTYNDPPPGGYPPSTYAHRYGGNGRAQINEAAWDIPTVTDNEMC